MTSKFKPAIDRKFRTVVENSLDIVMLHMLFHQ